VKSRGARVEFLTVASIDVLPLFEEARFGALGRVASGLSGALPAGRSYLIAAGVALWIGMALYSLRRRRERRRTRRLAIEI
jgi:hypothetical protein